MSFIATHEPFGGLSQNKRPELMDDSASEDNEESNTGEILQCTFPGCHKEFSSRWSLTRHVRTHTGERPFRCTTCGKEFVQKCSLKRHEQTHSQEKQWICDYAHCGKRFKLKEYLDVHKRTHARQETETLPIEDEDQVIQDAADAAGALIDQLRQRLVRMSVRHHEQLFAHQQREFQLTQSLAQCAFALEQAVTLLEQNQHPLQMAGSESNSNSSPSSPAIPLFLREAVKKFVPNHVYCGENGAYSSGNGAMSSSNHAAALSAAAVASLLSSGNINGSAVSNNIAGLNISGSPAAGTVSGVPGGASFLAVPSNNGNGAMHVSLSPSSEK